MQDEDRILSYDVFHDMIRRIGDSRISRSLA